MKFHKTYKADRTTYSYEYINENGDVKKVTIYPGKDGVTELDIKTLHYKDDYEVERNNANHRPPLSEKQRQEIKHWTENYVQDFQRLYGYTPNKSDLRYQIKEHFPQQYVLSIEYMKLLLEKEESSMLIDATDMNSDDGGEAIRDRISFLLKDLSVRDREIYRRVLLKKETNISVATDLGISDSYVSRIANQIREKLASDKFLKKFFYFSSDLPKNDRLEH